MQEDIQGHGTGFEGQSHDRHLGQSRHGCGRSQGVSDFCTCLVYYWGPDAGRRWSDPMHLTTRLLLLNVVLWGLLHTLSTTAVADMLGYPVPRLRPLHARIELAGDSFQETMNGLDNTKATSGRGLLTLAFGPTDWSEI